MTTTATALLNTTGYLVYHRSRVVDNDIIHTVYTTVEWIIVPVNLLGLITNSLNVIVYAINGVRDTVTICFFALSLCDLCYIIISNCSNMIFLMGVVRPLLLSHVTIDLTKFAFYESMVFEMSALIKTCIAVQWGCCIVFPFHVHSVFTNKRTTAVMVCLCMFSLASYVNKEFLDSVNYVRNPVFNNTYTNPSFNNSYTNPTFNNVIVGLSDLVRDILKTVVVFACEILVIVSLICIVYGMSSVVKHRQTLFGKTCDNQQKIMRDSKEVRVVKQVILLSVIHLICYTPVAFYALMTHLLMKGYIPVAVWYIPLSLAELQHLAGPVNAAINFFIYCTYNSKFRYRVMNICRPGRHSTTRSDITTEQVTVDQTY